ncbi:MAG: Riboflavin biosynthesis protein RibF [Firmicutes bacterium ADurb.Bin193]|nr:MAG: Riboflavin biosynthesis protein RibF [Firmicutes bacterium ADurb.Bin193]
MYIETIKREAYHSQDVLLAKPHVVALGAFDGLHKGHMQLVHSAVSRAAEAGISSCVFTFPQNPSFPPYITSDDQRIKLLKNAGIDLVVMRSFTEEFKRLSPREFFERYLIKRLNARMVVVGFNYRFGHKGEGSDETLRELCKSYGIGITVIPPVLYSDKPISSTRIRRAVEAGDFTSAADMLGRDFSVDGRVVKGQGIGALLGFPTANFELDKDRIMPPKGVYATKTEVDGDIYMSVTNLGGKPTIKKGIELIETHILNFGKSLYGKTIEVSFIKRLRDIQTFSSKEELSARLEQDVQSVKEFLDK